MIPSIMHTHLLYLLTKTGIFFSFAAWQPSILLPHHFWLASPQTSITWNDHSSLPSPPSPKVKRFFLFITSFCVAVTALALDQINTAVSAQQIYCTDHLAETLDDGTPYYKKLYLIPIYTYLWSKQVLSHCDKFLWTFRTSLGLF